MCLIERIHDFQKHRTHQLSHNTPVSIEFLFLARGLNQGDRRIQFGAQLKHKRADLRGGVFVGDHVSGLTLELSGSVARLERVVRRLHDDRER